MNPKLARLLTRFYPRSWRERYGAEFEELLETGYGGFSTLANVAWSGLRERVLPTQRLRSEQTTCSASFNSLCSRAPWAVFTAAPVSLLAAGYFVACLILWVGWRIFLPEADSPFGTGPRHGISNIYFQLGKYFYGSAPILVGWVIAFLAARRRAKVLWPWIGFLLLAWMGASARIQAGETTVPHGFGHIRMNFALWPLAQDTHDAIVHALVIFTLAGLPYLLWRFRSGRIIFS
jgi:hypothetical protein